MSVALVDKTFQDLWVLPHSTVAGKLHLPAWWRISSAMALTAGLAVNKLWLNSLDTVRYHNVSVLHEALERPPDVPLLTVCNHDSCMDDPFLYAGMKWKHIFSPSKFRWAVAGHNITYTKKSHAYLFSLGRALPIVRGAGVYQQSMDFCIERLNEGAWVHLFPEGKVNMTKELLRLKWGVGRLVSECRKVPLVVPMWHCGFDHILPNYPPYFPRIRRKATVLVGSPITGELSEMVDKLKQMRVQAVEMRKAVTDRIQTELYTLKSRAEQLHYKEFGIRVGSNSDAYTEESLNEENSQDSEPARRLIRSVVNTRNARTLTDANAEPGAAGSIVTPTQPPFGV